MQTEGNRHVFTCLCIYLYLDVIVLSPQVLPLEADQCHKETDPRRSVTFTDIEEGQKGAQNETWKGSVKRACE